MKKKLAILLSTSLVFLFGATLVLAQGSGGNPGVNVSLTNPFSKANSLFQLLDQVINNILLPIGGVLAVLAFIYSGFLYVMAQGKETEIAKAHRALLYTSIGTAVLLGSWALAQVIENTINQLK
jgi:SNF family Na+-dependent transporter